MEMETSLGPSISLYLLSWYFSGMHLAHNCNGEYLVLLSAVQPEF